MDLTTTTTISSREVVGDEADASNQMPFGKTRSRRRITTIATRKTTRRRRPSEQHEFGSRCRRRGQWPTSLIVPMLLLAILLAIMPNTLRAKIVEIKEEGKKIREEELMKPDSQLEAIQRILLQRQREDRTQEEEEDEAAKMEGDAGKQRTLDKLLRQCHCIKI
jgi:arylamine N-acetyltransferase